MHHHTHLPASRIFAALGVALLLSACTGKYNGEKRHASYAQQLTDSIEAVSREIDSCQNRLDLVHEQISERLGSFTMVNNPREAGPYFIFSDFRDRYPLKTTGVIARINTNGQFELIAALAGGNFESISATSGTDKVFSDTIKNDQALNYRADGLNTVLYAGAGADRVGSFIADNMLNNIKIGFHNPALVRTLEIPTEVKKEVALTYQLYDLQQQAARLELRIPMLHEKIKLLRAHRDRDMADRDSSKVSE